MGINRQIFSCILLPSDFHIVARVDGRLAFERRIFNRYMTRHIFDILCRRIDNQLFIAKAIDIPSASFGTQLDILRLIVAFQRQRAARLYPVAQFQTVRD